MNLLTGLQILSVRSTEKSICNSYCFKQFFGYLFHTFDIIFTYNFDMCRTTGFPAHSAGGVAN
jgi:hypothetical protein